MGTCNPLCRFVPIGIVLCLGCLGFGFVFHATGNFLNKCVTLEAKGNEARNYVRAGRRAWRPGPGKGLIFSVLPPLLRLISHTYKIKLVVGL